jgi:hypothetical protein
MGKRIFQAARPPKRLVIVHGLPHNGSYHNSSTQWWGEILQFLKSEFRYTYWQIAVCPRAAFCPRSVLALNGFETTPSIISFKIDVTVGERNS